MYEEQIIGFAFFSVIFTTLLMLTGACLMKRLDSLAHAIDEADKKYID
jgi:hypothetical protein